MTAEASYCGTQAVARAISLLKMFSDTQPEWSLSKLARAVDLNKTTAYRLLTALEREGMLTRNRRTGAYRLGPETIALGGRALRSNDLRSASHLELEALAQAVGEAATLEVLVGDQTLILEEVPASYLVATWQSIGTRYPAHATSTGQLLLAYRPDAERQAVLRPPFRRLAERTITDQEELARRLAQIRVQGYAIAVDELEPDFVAVSAPVRNHDGQVVAAVSIGGPATRLNPSRLPDVVRTVIQAGQRVSARLGYSAK
jgi:DNA-binding IclR family transcriptional regulator